MLSATLSKPPSKKRLSLTVTAWAAFATFTTYFCMYGFRKGISAATFDGIYVGSISFKSALVIAQVFGYMTAKFVGIKFISELNKNKRGTYILTLIGSAHACLLLLAIVPTPVNIIFLFANGLCLGLIWGLVFSYIEGRRFTDFLALVLSINFIFSSGVVKSIGRMCIEYGGVSEIYMPFVAGLFFIPLLLLSVWMLNRIPPPTEEEVMSRGTRIALNGPGRMKLFRKFLTGLVAVILVNLILTILRDVKDNYAIEILRALRPDYDPAIFSQMETIAAVCVFCFLIALAAIKNHFRSIMFHHIIIALGMCIILIASWRLRQNSADPVITLIIYSIGLYICYNTLQCLFLDRFIAAFGITANIGFFFYLMDSIGYLGSCFFIVKKELFNNGSDWLHYFIQISFFLGIVGLLGITTSMVYFYRKHRSLLP